MNNQPRGKGFSFLSFFLGFLIGIIFLVGAVAGVKAVHHSAYCGYKRFHLAHAEIARIAGKRRRTLPIRNAPWLRLPQGWLWARFTERTPPNMPRFRAISTLKAKKKCWLLP